MPRNKINRLMPDKTVSKRYIPQTEVNSYDEIPLMGSKIQPKQPRRLVLLDTLFGDMCLAEENSQLNT
ncbi:hypothetical protein AYI70_g7112 [Smittium culicis]|uniref:Uncharacterized protein n=1 Tax=Smittium culicis TaxID=133412 RepID=A0A1R1XM26_9FUNG|nr:hypothetical protein AYI70_g7112 [Smittium culicis]